MHCCEVNHAVFVGTWAAPPHPSIPPLPSNASLFAIVPGHVDDYLIVCNSLSLYSWIISELQKHIEIFVFILVIRLYTVTLAAKSGSHSDLTVLSCSTL
jgi:hypothetical protein